MRIRISGAGIVRALFRVVPRPAAGDTVSAQWLRDYQRSTARVEYIGPRVRFPIVPPSRQNSLWNRFALKRRSA
jgi:hypothetical protein